MPIAELTQNRVTVDSAVRTLLEPVLVNTATYKDHETLIKTAATKLRTAEEIRQFYGAYVEVLVKLDPDIQRQNLVEIRKRAENTAASNVAFVTEKMSIQGTCSTVWSNTISQLVGIRALGSTLRN